VKIGFLVLACVGGCMERDALTVRRNASAIDPVGLVREYVKRDADGERLGPSTWFADAVTWPVEQGYESYTVIRGHTVEKPKAIHGSPARIAVRYDVLGWIAPMGAEWVFMEQVGEEVFEFVVLRTETGWRIDAPQIDQHVLAEVAAARPSRTAEDAARIRELAAQAPDAAP
jgi:hypothetical protein